MNASAAVAPRDYQAPAVEALWRHKRAILKAPAGSGKTLMLSWAIDRWLECWLGDRKARVVWLAHTIEQCEQAEAALKVCNIREKAKVTVSCYQGYPKLAVLGSDLLVCDECHHVASPENAKLIRLADGVRWGCSATPERADELAPLVYELLGPIVHTVQREGLVDRGQLAKGRVILLNDTDPNLERPINSAIAVEMKRRTAFRRTQVSADDMWPKVAWQVCLEMGIIANGRRNAAIVRTALQHPTDSVLILVPQIEHGKALQAEIPGSEMCFSKMGAKKRRAALEAFKAGEIKHLLATSLADEGFDAPIANVLIQAQGGRSRRAAEQRTGRVLRAFPGKEHGLIYDFIDEQHPLLRSQSRKRVGVYRELRYEVVEQRGTGTLPL